MCKILEFKCNDVLVLIIVPVPFNGRIVCTNFHGLNEPRYDSNIHSYSILAN